ncbi:AAA family ATPase [Marinifilum sp. D714]|uniref:AAA family ATPase n=1 Tax=Marinifilum sp. D714 TaxID=2937523 RepID=UPI0027D0BEC3|nr:AAA family ATPase [Marinifilum sp. D714]MDQ2178393.1 ATP-binding protein [Marinifilum sp. D714]
MLSGFTDLSDCEAADSLKHKTPDTMELLYVWIEDYKNIKKQGFNFSPKHWFDFEYEVDEEGKVIGGTLHHKERNTNYPENFFGENISNVTAIVGKNGSGKSNLMEFIILFCSSSHGLNEYNKNIVFIYESAGRIYTNRSQLKCNLKLYPKNYIQYPFNRYSNNATKLIFYSPHTEKHMLEGLGSDLAVDDISDGGMLKDDFMTRNGESFLCTDIELLQMEDSLRHIQLFKLFLQTKFRTHITIPKELYIQINASIEFNEEINNKNYRRFYHRDDNLSFMQHIENRLLNQIFANNNSMYTETYASFEELIIGHYSFEFYKQLQHLNNSDFIVYQKEPYPLGKFDYHFTFRIKTENLSDDFMRGLYYYYFQSKVHYGLTTLSFTRNLSRNIFWKWNGISSGEMSMYNLYGRLLETTTASQFVNSNIKKIILLLDEPETSFHPEWQRIFITEFMPFINEICNKVNVQIFINSHSPFLVSDLPKDNIIFLNKKENGDCEVKQPEDMTHTFGANIHSLYRNSFFLENGLMGEFAKEKIDQVIQDLNQQDPKSNISDERKQEILFIIEQIGEPILQEKLKKRYKEIFEPLDRRIEELRSELAQLEALQNLKS